MEAIKSNPELALSSHPTPHNFFPSSSHRGEVLTPPLWLETPPAAAVPLPTVQGGATVHFGAGALSARQARRVQQLQLQPATAGNNSIERGGRRGKGGRKRKRERDASDPLRRSWCLLLRSPRRLAADDGGQPSPATATLPVTWQLPGEVLTRTQDGASLQESEASRVLHAQSPPPHFSSTTTQFLLGSAGSCCLAGRSIALESTHGAAAWLAGRKGREFPLSLSPSPPPRSLALLLRPGFPPLLRTPLPALQQLASPFLLAGFLAKPSKRGGTGSNSTSINANLASEAAAATATEKPPTCRVLRVCAVSVCKGMRARAPAGLRKGRDLWKGGGGGWQGVFSRAPAVEPGLSPTANSRNSALPSESFFFFFKA